MDSGLLSGTFVDLADFDEVDYMHLLTDRSVALLAASAGAVVLAGQHGELLVAAALASPPGSWS